MPVAIPERQMVEMMCMASDMAKKKADNTMPGLREDELTSDCYLKLAELIAEGRFDKCSNDSDYLSIARIGVNQQLSRSARLARFAVSKELTGRKLLC